MRLILILLMMFFTAFAQPFSDVRLEIISEIKKLEEEKSKTKDRNGIKEINKKIKKLKELLKKYEKNTIIAG